jgi:hypothetical protein
LHLPSLGGVNRTFLLCANRTLSFCGDTTDDEADACVLAHIGACLIGREEPRNKAQRDVLITLTAEKKKKTRKLKDAA